MIILKKKLLVGTLASVLLLSGGVVFAGSDWSPEESRTLPGRNGSAYSSTQEKKAVGLAGLKMHATEGYNIDVRTIGSVNGGWTRDVRGGNTYSISAPQPVKSEVQLHFSSDLFSPTTNIVYSWRSN